MKTTRLLILLFALICASCECPLKEELKQGRQGDGFTAETLLGTWQCSYDMIIGNMELKQIRFFSNGKADITMAEQHQVDWYTVTYSYTYYGNTLRFSMGRSNFSLTIKGFLFPELYLYDSFGTYTITKRRVD
jgi:hypothetical protein